VSLPPPPPQADLPFFWPFFFARSCCDLPPVYDPSVAFLAPLFFFLRNFLLCHPPVVSLPLSPCPPPVFFSVRGPAVHLTCRYTTLPRCGRFRPLLSILFGLTRIFLTRCPPTSLLLGLFALPFPRPRCFPPPFCSAPPGDVFFCVVRFGCLSLPGRPGRCLAAFSCFGECRLFSSSSIRLDLFTV